MIQHEKNRVVVICTRCGNPAKYDPPDGAHPYGVWHWGGKCPYCGANEWASHDPARNIHTGRIQEEPKG